MAREFRGYQFPLGQHAVGQENHLGCRIPAHSGDDAGDDFDLIHVLVRAGGHHHGTSVLEQACQRAFRCHRQHNACGRVDLGGIGQHLQPEPSHLAEGKGRFDHLAGLGTVNMHQRKCFSLPSDGQAVSQFRQARLQLF